MFSGIGVLLWMEGEFLMLKKCEVCGKEYDARKSTSVVCSRQCSWKWKVEKIGKFWVKPKRPPRVLVCAWCQQEYVSKVRGRKQHECCSRSCATSLRAHRNGLGMQAEFTCEECGRKKMVSAPEASTRRFCSKSCLAKNKMRRPEIREALYSEKSRRKISEGLVEFYRTDAGREVAKKSSERILSRSSDMAKAISEKSKETKRRKGILHIWSGERGGNGKIPLTQAVLLEALGDGWETEFPIPTKVKKGNGYPTCYKVDLALPRIRLAVEVDGSGHRSKRILLLDAKKTRFLNGLGWIVLRCTNRDVTRNLSRTLFRIRTVQEDLLSSTT